MRPRLHSLRWQLQAWYGLFLLGVVVAFCLAGHRLAWDNQLRRVDKQLVQLRHELMGGVLRALSPEGEGAFREGRLPPIPPDLVEKRLEEGGIALPRDVQDRFQGAEPGHAYFLIASIDGRTLLHSDNLPAGPPLSTPPGIGPPRDGETIANRRQIVERVGDGMRIVVGRDISPERDDMRRFSLSLAAAGLGVWLVSLIGGWWIAGRAIKPIQTISRTAMRIAAGRLEERISTGGNSSELDQLSHILNGTFDRLAAILDQQKRFTADASHELRTPVTVLLSETRRILKRERTAQEYQDVIRTCERIGQRIQRLIESLLLLAHQESAAATQRNESCDLAELAAASVEQLQTIANERGIRIEATLRPARCQGQPAALSILANNLIANAIQHQRGPGHVWVETGIAGQDAVLRVRDEGPGISAEDLPRIFERFYRADKARTGESGHAGLGLAIVKTIIENHGGRVGVESEYGHGACFTASLPTR